MCAWLYDIISILFSSKTLRAVTGREPVKKGKNLLEGINCCHSYSWINYINSDVKLGL